MFAFSGFRVRLGLQNAIFFFDLYWVWKKIYQRKVFLFSNRIFLPPRIYLYPTFFSFKFPFFLLKIVNFGGKQTKWNYLFFSKKIFEMFYHSLGCTKGSKIWLFKHTRWWWKMEHFFSPKNNNLGEKIKKILPVVPHHQRVFWRTITIFQFWMTRGNEKKTSTLSVSLFYFNHLITFRSQSQTARTTSTAIWAIWSWNRLIIFELKVVFAHSMRICVFSGLTGIVSLISSQWSKAIWHVFSKPWAILTVCMPLAKSSMKKTKIMRYNWRNKLYTFMNRRFFSTSFWTS